MGEELVESIQDPMINIIKEHLEFVVNSNANSIRRKLAWIKSQLTYIAKKQYDFHDKRTFKDLTTSSAGYYSIHEANLNAKTLDQIYLKLQEIINFMFQNDDGIGTRRELEYAIYYQSDNQETGKKELHRAVIQNIPDAMLTNSKYNAQLRVQSSKKEIQDWQNKLKEQAVLSKIDKHFQNFFQVLNNSYEKDLPTPTISYGRIAEAFERHLSRMHQIYGSNLEQGINMDFDEDISRGSAWRLVRESMGSAAWYTGGDVGHVQVKSIITGPRGITNYNTLEDLVNYLEYLLKFAKSNVDKAAQEFFKIFAQKEEQILDEQLYQELEDESIKMTEQLLLKHK